MRVRASCLVLTLSSLLCTSLSLHAQNEEWPEYPALDSAWTSNDAEIWRYHREIRADSFKLTPYIRLIDRHRKNGEHEQALYVADAMIAANPDSALAWFVAGDTRLDNGMVEEGIGAFRQAIALAPDYVRAYTTIAEAFEMAQLYDSALVELESALRLNPRNAQAHVQAAELLVKLGRHGDAVEHYRVWAELAPFDFQPWLRLGGGLVTIGEYEEAQQVLRYALTLDSASADAHWQLAKAQQGLGGIDETIKAFLGFMFRFPTDERALEAEREARALGWSP